MVEKLTKRDVLRMAIELSGLALDLCTCPENERRALASYVRLRAARYGRLISYEIACDTEANDAQTVQSPGES